MAQPAELAPGVHVAQSRPYATNTTVLVDGARALVIDPAWFERDLENLAAWLSRRGLSVAAGAATHEHFDHVLWHPAFGDVPRWASGVTATRLAGSERTQLLEPAAAFLSAELMQLAGRLTPLNDETVPWPGPEVICVTHDAHARGHIAMFCPDTGTLIAGDMLSDLELPMPDDADTTLEPYLRGLDALEPWVRQARLLVPGHGSATTDPVLRLSADRRYLETLIEGRTPRDPRLHNPGMDQVHRMNVQRAAATP